MSRAQNKRKSIPADIATQVLVAANRICCICRQVRHNVQLHHIDGDATRNILENLAVLCPNCHSEVSGTGGFGRSYSPAEVRAHKLQWERHCERRDGSEHDAESAATTLSRWVTEAARRTTLYASVGEGDFLRSWLARLLEKASAEKSRVMISRLVIKRLDPQIVKRLARAGQLEPGFEARLTQNILALRVNAEIKALGIEVDERRWKMPAPFHGFLFGKNVLVNKWAVDKAGRLHVRTRVASTTKEQLPDWYRYVKNAFEGKN